MKFEDSLYRSCILYKHKSEHGQHFENEFNMNQIEKICIIS